MIHRTARIEVTLAPQESFAISQFARYMAPDEGAPHLSQQFLLEFAVVFLHHTNANGSLVPDANPEQLFLSIDDVLNLIELVPVTATVGSSPVGLSLHHKLYEALLRCHPEAATELRFGEMEEPTREALATQLEQLKRGRRKRGKRKS